MVSTRQVKYKFSEGERVLCYEPDQTKAKVLYDSKVLKVRVTRDINGKKIVKYHIHFQGWKTTWDREVPEDYVLKDNEENRKLQQQLAELAQMNLGSYPYRRDRKKRSVSASEREKNEKKLHSDNGDESTRDEAEYLIATDIDEDQDSAVETDDSTDQIIPLNFSTEFRTFIETDYRMINEQKKLLRLPASPNVIEILQRYVTHTGLRLRHGNDSKNSGHRSRSCQAQPKSVGEKGDEFDTLCDQVNIIKEVVDGIRICFDFYLGSQLLYAYERDQHAQIMAGTWPLSRSPLRGTDSQLLLPIKIEGSPKEVEIDNDRRRTLRSHREVSSPEPHTSNTNGILKNNLASGSIKSSSSNSSCYVPLSGLNLSYEGGSTSEISRLINVLTSWMVVPDSYFEHKPPYPSSVYGALHLARLLVKLPTFLFAANLNEKENQPKYLPDSKMKTLLNQLQHFLEYLESSPELFNESQYIDLI